MARKHVRGKRGEPRRILDGPLAVAVLGGRWTFFWEYDTEETTQHHLETLVLAGYGQKCVRSQDLRILCEYS